MPEGDTLRKIALRLTETIVGQELTGGSVPAVLGRRVRSVESRGKNLLIHLDDGRAIYSHLVMRGSWHVYRPGEPWMLPEHRAALVLATPAFVAVCFDTKQVRLLSERALLRFAPLTSLGPDLLAPEPDLERAVAGFLEVPELPIGEAVMMQRLVAGIGNIYKSESLFEARIHPFSTVEEVGADGVRRILDIARELLTASVDRAKVKSARTRGARMMAFGRAGEPCYVCGAAIEVRRQGQLGRTTYWCPSCQPAV